MDTRGAIYPKRGAACRIEGQEGQRETTDSAAAELSDAIGFCAGVPATVSPGSQLVVEICQIRAVLM